MWNWIKQRLGRAPPTAESRTSAITADAPITRADQDLLGRKVIAERVADIIASGGQREGRVFAICGAWGDGKSSLKNLVIERLGTRAPVLDFNPWQWGDSDAIARALFTQMAGKIGGAHGPEAHKRAAALRRYGSMFASGGRLMDKLGTNAIIVAAIGSTAVTIAAAFGLTLKDVDAAKVALGIFVAGGAISAISSFVQWLGRDASSDTLDTVRGAVERRLRTLPSPLAVFVDDIDRLEPEQIRALVRQIKANANLPNINFVLLFQPSIVEQALAPVAGGNGRDYLEKIVQANFDLPPVARETVRHVFGTQLGEIVDAYAVAENGFQQVRWGNVFLGGILRMLRNLRDARRLLSSVAIHLEMHKGAAAFEVNIIDFIALETLRVFEPDLYRTLPENKALLLQSQRFSGDGRQDRDREAVAHLLALASAERKEAVDAIIKDLFPTIEWAMGGMYYNGGGDWHAEWMQNKRVCTRRTFDRYFALQTAEGAITESDFASLVQAAADETLWAAAVDDLLERGLRRPLARRLDESVDALPLTNPARWLSLILTNGEEIGREASSLFNDDFVASWRSAIRYLKRFSSPEALTIYRSAMETTGVVNVAAQVVSLERQSRANARSSYERVFSDQDLVYANEAWVVQMRLAARNTADMLSNDNLVSNLYDWKHIAGDEPRDWAVGVVENDPTTIPKMLARFMSVGTSQGVSDYVGRKTESFRREYFEELLTVTRLMASIERLDTRVLNSEDQRILALFLDHERRWRIESASEPDDDG